MRRSLVLVAMITVGCADDRHGAEVAAKAPPEPAAAAASSPPDLLAGVPADSVFVLALREPLAAAVWDRLAWDVAPFVGRLAAAAESRLAEGGIVDPVERLQLALSAALPGPLGADTRVVIHELRGLGVVRLEVVDEVVLRAAVSSAADRAGVASTTPSQWIAEGASDALALVIVGRQLAIAVGPIAGVRAIVPVLTGAEPLGVPAIDAAALPPVGGYVDLGGVVRLALAKGGGSAVCRAAIQDLLAEVAPMLPRISLALPTLTAERAELVATFALDPALAALVGAAPAVTAGVPATFPGKPIVGFSFLPSSAASAALFSQMWVNRAKQLSLACDPGAAMAIQEVPTTGAPHGGAFAFYGSTSGDGGFPTDVQAYLTILANAPDALWRDLAGLLPGLFGRVPTDGAGFRALPIAKVPAFVRPVFAHAARRGGSLMIAVGAAGLAQGETALAAAEAPPLIHLFLDVARLAASDADELDVPGPGLAAEAGLAAALARIISTFDLTIGGELRATATLAARAPQPAAVPASPRRIAAMACRRLLDRSWTSAARSLARLGITTGVDAIEDTFRDGFDSAAFFEPCVDKLSDEARACLLAAADPLAALSECRATSLEPPRLFDRFDEAPTPMELRRAVGAPPLAALVGEWVSTDDDGDRWTIDSDGKATHTDGRGRKRYTVEVQADGDLKVSAGGGWSNEAFVLAGPDELYLGGIGVAHPMASEDSFLVGFRADGDDAWIVRDAQGCLMIDERGRNAIAECTFADRDGARWLEASYPGGRQTFLVLHGHLVDSRLTDDHYRRVR